jgi:hypothetical protein
MTFGVRESMRVEWPIRIHREDLQLPLRIRSNRRSCSGGLERF